MISGQSQASVSPFDARDADVQVTGSGGVGMVAQLGQDLVREVICPWAIL